MQFVLALHSDDGEKFGVTVPDLPGCLSAGDTFDEAVESARAAIDAHCELLAQHGEDLPLPVPLAVHRKDAALAGAIWVVIDIDVTPYQGKAEKIDITVPARVLRRIDEFARTHGQTRSGFLTQAALEAMRRGNG